MALICQGVLCQTFTLSTGILSDGSARTGNCVGIADMDGDGYDDLVLLDESKRLYIDYQGSNGSFTSFDYGNVSGSNQWGMCAGDIDGDGHKDIISGGSYDGVHFMEISSRGVSSLSSLNNGSMFMQAMNTADINNDGHLDVFGCHDDAASRIWLNNGSGALSYNNYINFATTPASDMSGNYGSVWIDFDNDGDLDLQISHCRQGVNNPSDPRRWNRLFVNDGNNNYTDLAATFGMQNQEQTWTTDFGDLDNDGDLDAVSTNHSTTMQVFLNDGSGNYTDATAGSGIEFSGFFLQSKLEDLDNDGNLDLITAGAEYYFKGDGDGTFTRIMNMLPEPGTGYTLNTFATGDLNHDGFIDIYAGYGSGYVTPSTTRDDELYLNNGNSNHFLNFDLKGVDSNPDAVGARVTLYGPWGTQIREVRGGESYGIVCSFTCHFGLGSTTMADSAVVRWPSGSVDRFYNVAADQWVEVTEGETTLSLLAMKALLSGPYDGGTQLMNDGLRQQGLLPLLQPYGGFGLVITGTETMEQISSDILNVTGPNAIVDWVWLELRDANASGSVLFSRPALVQRDGDVVELDGYRPVAMGAPAGNYYVAVRHRNHLGCMTSAAIALGPVPVSIDLTAPGTGVHGTNARQFIGPLAALWTGNVVFDAQVKYAGSNNDRDGLLNVIGGSVPTAVSAGYLASDVNMDGAAKYAGAQNDRDRILQTVGGSVPTAVRLEQIP
ncbi:MAG: VCBS repeat-containing protein [Flavobacteriales bacterium]|nr:VCBS repeat-containing protein [Flavobacteriales bacterium]